MSRSITKTFNPVIGCEHDCSYCWARELAEGRLRHVPRYQNGFKPALIEEEFTRKFKPGEFVFVSSMGDLFGEWVPQEWIRRVLAHVSKFPDTRFLLQTKNPGRFFELRIPPNAFIGTTIESNIYYPNMSKAPIVAKRYFDLKDIIHFHKFISIEPIIDFDLETMTQWMKDIAPEIIEIGYDNYGHHLPEPPLAKTQELITKLRKFTQVRTKTIRKAWNE